ncbi:MAG: ornithine carbamoyltransferase [Candidatus Aminicenantes bacterium]|jgi:ornithine carbamoyltransferase
MNLKGRDFIGLIDFNKDELEGILSFAEDIKCGRNGKKYLAGKSVGLLFSVASTRTRISFQVGTRQLGGSADFYNADELQLVYHESLIDTAAVISRYLDLLVVRMYDMKSYDQGRESLNTIAKHADIPIINALDDKDHPCQVMGDILTLKEKFGEDYKNKKVVFTWGYAKRQKSPGVPQSMLIAASLLGMNLTLVHLKGFDLDDEYVDFARKAVKKSGGKLEFSRDLMEASQGADVIYVKSWKSLKMSCEKDIEVRNKIRSNWCVSEEHFNRANPGAYFMNCLPIIRGEQATADVIDGEHSIIYDEAENRLHVQKAIMATSI